MQIPKIRKMLIDDLGFSSNQINGNMPNGNQLVAYGAALYAAKHASNNSLVTICFIFIREQLTKL